MSAHQFKVGDHVVCVDARLVDIYAPWNAIGDLAGLKDGSIYTIRRLGLFVDVPCMWLEEIYRPLKGGDPEEPRYALQRFRPVQKRATDISIFTALLNTQDEMEEVPFR